MHAGVVIHVVKQLNRQRHLGTVLVLGEGAKEADVELIAHGAGLVGKHGNAEVLKRHGAQPNLKGEGADDVVCRDCFPYTLLILLCKSLSFKV